MRVYFLREFQDSAGYQAFLAYMLRNSDVFSFTFCKRAEGEKTKKAIRLIADRLKRFKISSRQTHQWPGTVSFDPYLYQLVYYRADEACLEVLKSRGGVYDWLYPEAPEDLCFYKNGYCWLATTSHEKMGFLYTDNAAVVTALKELGADLFRCDEDKEPVPAAYEQALQKYNRYQK